MILGKKKRIGKKVEEITIGESLKLTEKIADKDILLYLGLTNDVNPLYIQHDFASQTTYEKPIVPSVMLTGIITSAISKHLPGPGSHIIGQNLAFPKPIYHYATIGFHLEVVDINEQENTVVIKVDAHDEEDMVVVTGTVTVIPLRRLLE